MISKQRDGSGWGFGFCESDGYSQDHSDDGIGDCGELLGDAGLDGKSFLHASKMKGTEDIMPWVKGRCSDQGKGTG